MSPSPGAQRVRLLASHFLAQLCSVHAVATEALQSKTLLQDRLTRLTQLKTAKEFSTCTDLLWLRLLGLHPDGFQVPIDDFAEILGGKEGVATVTEKHGYLH
jgi:hypothetical protein